MRFKTIKLKIENESYPIVIGAGLFGSLKDFIPRDTSSIIVISDEILVPKRKELLRNLKALSFPVTEIPVAAGEGLKNIKAIYPLFGELIEAKADRNTLLIALGGGSIGDATGFIASTFLRGIRWMGIPTTLLSQVDSSVGGKTGINHELGKNLIGTFYQPSVVFCDVNLLKSLGSREMISGLGEIVKYALTFDKSFFKWLESNIDDLILNRPDALSEAITWSLEWKCHNVSQDVFDRKGIREVLNFGHTFGHALESATKYKKYQHGEAVIWGMRFAISLSVIRGQLSEKKATRMRDLLMKLDVPGIPQKLTKSEIFGHMKRDKKSQGNSIRFVLLDDIGSSISDSGVTKSDLDKAFKSITGREV